MTTVTVDLTPAELQLVTSALMFMGTFAPGAYAQQESMKLWSKLIGIRVVGELVRDDQPRTGAEAEPECTT